MRKIFVAAGVFLAAALAQVGAANAVGEDVFVVPRVPVQAQAESATAAKAAAQRMGRRRAMDILLRRLIPEEDWVFLPQLVAGMPAEAMAELYSPDGGFGKAPISLSDQDLEALESGFEVYDEKSSSKTYRAFVTYRFKPAAVRGLLKDARLPYSEAQTRTALVLPVLETDNGLYLWEENNPWMAAWNTRPLSHELTPMTAPLGDLEDAATINARQALALNEDRLREMAQRYAVSQVIIAHARLRQANEEDRLRVLLINGYRESGVVLSDADFGDATGRPGLNDFDQAPAASDPFSTGPQEEIAARVGDVLAEVWFRAPSGNFPRLAEQAIESAIAKYASDWKARTLIDHSAAIVLEASAFFRSIEEWMTIRAALVATPLVGSVQVSAFSRRGAEMAIRAFGDPGKLVVAMEEQGVSLWTEDGEHWLIATPATANEVRGRNSLRRRRGRLGDAVDYSDPVGVAPASAEPAEGAESKIDTP
ncbi:MAG: DUF2066 domain-containing protein [Parvularculaceae bacterium]